MPLFAHIGTGFAGKKYAPDLPTWLLVVASMFIDILAIFFAARWATHGLSMALIWTALAVVATYILANFHNSKIEENQENKNEKQPVDVPRACKIIGILVFGHWILDFIGWPLSIIDPAWEGVPFFFSNSPNFGLGVYRTWTGAIIMDLGLFALGLVIYFKSRKNVISQLNHGI